MGGNNANNTAQPTAQQPAALVMPKEPGFCEDAWTATKIVAGASAAEFTLGFFKAAGIALGTCVVLKAFGVFDRTSDNA